MIAIINLWIFLIAFQWLRHHFDIWEIASTTQFQVQADHVSPSSDNPTPRQTATRTHIPPRPEIRIPINGPQVSAAPGPEDPPAKGPRQPKPLSSHMLRPSHHPFRGGTWRIWPGPTDERPLPLALAGPATKASISAPISRNFDCRFWLIYRYKILPVILLCKMTGKILYL